MNTPDNTEIWDRLTILLAAEPRPGWEDIFDAISRREVERLAPYPQSPHHDRDSLGNEKGAAPAEDRPQTLKGST